MAKPLPSSVNLGDALHEALALHRAGRLAEADKGYSRILKAHPDLFDALHLLGMVRLQRGKAGEAYQLIAAALKINPQSADALSNYGLVLNALKRGDDALASFEKALAIAPDHIDALNNRGNALLARGRVDEALQCFERILGAVPGHLQAQVNRGIALAELSRQEEALAIFEAVLHSHPGDVIVQFNRANALLALGRVEEALSAYERVVAVAPDHASAHNNRGLVLAALNRHQEAAASYAQAIAIRKDYADAHFNRSLSLLTLGDYPQGFAAYEWRWRRTGMTDPRSGLGKPLWVGQTPLQRKTILVTAEQGLGDTVQFVRYLPMLTILGAEIVLEVQPELVALLSRMAGVTRVVPRGAARPNFDVHCPLGTLPLALRTEIATVPANVPYLRASEDKIATWRARLGDTPTPRIAIAWAGSAAHVNDRNRSIPLAMLTPLLSLDRTTLFGVQRDLREGDAAWLAAHPGFVNLASDFHDFDDTAAVLALADHVVTVDTAIAHLAGAMGRPTLLMVPYSPDWRWTLDRDVSPWYPTIRLFRQTARDDWTDVVARVRAELARVP